MAEQDESSAVRTGLIYWTLQIVCWALFFQAQASGEAIFAGVPESKARLMWGGVCLTGIALTHTLRVVSKRRAWLALPTRALLIRIVAGVLLVSLAHSLITTGLALAVYGTPVSALLLALYRTLPLGRQLFNQFINSFAIIAVWTAIYFSVVLQRHRHAALLRQAQLAEALQAAQLRLLKAQLNPHFLFNALNGVRALIAGEPAKAQDAVTRLARTLRYTLASGDEDFVTLARELEMVDDYLELESLRLAERLTVVREIAPEALALRVPVMLLQTLVENAIKHGIAQLKPGGDVRITAHVTGQDLIVEVENSCPANAQAQAAPDSIGLKNLSERLRLMFGAAAKVDLDFSRPGRARASVRLPA